MFFKTWIKEVPTTTHDCRGDDGAECFFDGGYTCKAVGLDEYKCIGCIYVKTWNPFAKYKIPKRRLK